MATWRIKGYVSDSEGEDDLCSSSHRKVDQDIPLTSIEHNEVTTTALEAAPLTLKPPNQSTTGLDESSNLSSSQLLQSTSAVALQQTLSEGLTIIRDVLSQSPTHTGLLQLTADTESPLSTPPDSPIIPPLEPANEPIDKITSPPQQVDVLPVQRALRHRNAVQQHPYTHDRANYMILLAGSGHRPIRDIDTLKRPKHVDESQESTFEASSQILNSPELDSMDIELLADTQGVDDPLSWPSMGEELPDIEYLLNRQSPTRNNGQHATILAGADVSRSHKNMRTPKSAIEQPRRPMKLGKTLKSGASNEQQNSIPSPPRSTSTASVDFLASQGEKSLIQSPPLLPTPLLSSGLRRKRLVIEDDTQSLRTDDPTPAQSDLSDADDSRDEKSASEELRVMQRKIKGVLPASWWSIGRLQDDLRKKSRNSHAISASRPEVGVAQRKSNLSPNRNHDGPARSAFLEDLASEESDDEDNRNPENRYQQTSLPSWTPRTSPAPHARDEEAIEIMDEHTIDPMFPTRSRHAHTSTRNKRQTDLRDVLLETRANGPKGRSSASNLAGTDPNRGQASRKRLRRKRTERDFGILDAPDVQTNRHEDLPEFLRVATRQARRKARASRPKAASTKSSRPGNPNGYIEHVGLQNSITHRTNPTTLHSTAQIRSIPDFGLDLESVGSSRIKRHALGTTSPIARRTFHPENQTHVADTLPEMTLPLSTEENSGKQDAQSLRLTRLRSLLPFSNRSGSGRLVSKTSLPRSAQFEEFRPLLRFLPRNPSKPALNISPPKLVPAPRPPAALVTQAALRPAKIVPGRKKQIPKKSTDVQQTLLIPHQPADRQLRLAYEANDPNLRQLLHAEFNDYQMAWFQGRKLGQVCATLATQFHFDVFLEVLKAHLSIAAQDTDNNHDARDLNSFLHRLLPNRREIGAQGQIGDKVFDVLEQDILVARNVFDLHVCLLNLAPGCAPRPRVLEMMVNFTYAHHEICKIALFAWEAIYTYHHTDGGIARGLTSWMYSILSQLVARWHAAEIDAKTDADKAGNRVAESLIRKVIELNRSQACGLLCQVHRVLEMGVKTATTIAEVNSLLDIQSYLKHLDVVSRYTDMAEDVYVSAVLIAKSYLEIWKRWHPTATIMALLGGVRQSIASLTSGRRDLSQNMQKTMVEVYFLLAQTAMEQRQKHWDDFIEPTSSFSLDMFVSQKYLQSMKTAFFHFIVERETEQYLLEFRALILNHWVLILFQQHEDDFAELLTCSLFKHEKESLAMPKLASSIVGPDDIDRTNSIHQSLPEIRHHTVAHIVPYLYEQEHNPEGEWLVGGLEDADSVTLLRTMFSTMKATWMSLHETPDEQDLYTILIHFALDQYETYPRSDFKIEPWFFNSATFPQRRKHTLARILQRAVSDDDHMREGREVLRREIAHAQRFQRFAQLEEDMKEMLIPLPREDVPMVTSEGRVWTIHAAFIREAFPEIIVSTNSEASQARTMILNVLVDILSNLECRLSDFRPDKIQSFITATYPIVSALARMMHQLNNEDRSKTFVITGLAFEWSAGISNELSEEFLDSVGLICDIAGDDDCEEALELLQTVIARR